MRLLRQQIQHNSRADIFTLYYLTDLHLGHKACDETQLRKDIQAIADNPFARWIGGGDYIDAICQVGDKRYKPSLLATWLHGEDDVMGREVEQALSYLAPIASQCIGLVKGNHEHAAETWYARTVYWDIVRGIASIAQVEPQSLALGTQGFIQIVFARGTGDKKPNATWQLMLYCHHGFGGGKLAGGHALNLERVLGTYDCDLALMGHIHVLRILSKQTVHATRKGVRVKSRYAAFVPSYLASYIDETKPYPVENYGELAGLSPTPIGTFPIVIHPDKRKFTLVISTQVHDLET